MRLENESWRNFVFVAVAKFVFDGREGAQLKACDVGENGGSANGDAVLDGKAGDGAQELVYFGGGPEIERVRSEVTGEVRFEIGFELVVDVAQAEFRAGQDGKAAATTGVVDVTA